MWHGILVINKERGLTSHQVIADLRRILAQTEVGHTGTLDPEATGVLVVGLGEATRSFIFLNEAVKVYRAEFVLGQTTDTQDVAGKIITEKPETLINPDELGRSIGELSGEILQTPPMYSAVKVNGRKLYELARDGLEVERQPRKIKVFNWSILNPKPSYGFRERIVSEITCSKGTYIRTLVHDLGIKLGCGAHLVDLVRLKSGNFSLEDAAPVAQVREYFAGGRLGEILFSLNTALSHLVPLWIQDDDLDKIKHGGKLSFFKYRNETPPGTIGRALDQHSQVLAIVELRDNGSYLYWQPVKVFNYS